MAQVLRDLPQPTDPNLLVGAHRLDDAGVYRISDDTALVTTVDFFPPLVDDPFAFGQIAAANSLSDVYAMGAKPLCALNVVGFPDKDLPLDILLQILAGGAERVTAAGAVIAGGHSVRDAEIKYGLSVTGIVHPNRVLTNSGAKPGDVLVLTKPLGTGTLTTAAKKGFIEDADLAEAIDTMIDLNRGASESACEVGVHAVTDVTGFGLLGHAHEMAEASDVTIQFEATRVPLMGSVLRLAQQGVLTRTHKATVEYLGERLSVGNVDATLVNVLADAQTSGGLLIAVPEAKSAALVSALQHQRAKSAAVIGTVAAASTHRVVLL